MSVEAYDPADLMVHTLVAHLDGLKASLGLTRVNEGWPHADRRLVMPAVTVTAARDDNEPHSPQALSTRVNGTGPGDTGEQTVRVGRGTARLQLDLWTSSRPERKRLKRKLVALLSGTSDRPALWLDAVPWGESTQPAALDGVTVAYRYNGSRLLDGEGAVGRDEYRAVLEVEADVDSVVVEDGVPVHVVTELTATVGVDPDSTEAETFEDDDTEL